MRFPVGGDEADFRSPFHDGAGAVGQLVQDGRIGTQKLRLYGIFLEQDVYKRQIRNYQGIKELDATIINALIDKILVSECEKLTDGTIRQEIKIYYKFIGFVGELRCV